MTVLSLSMLWVAGAMAAPQADAVKQPAPKVRYRGGQNVSFDQLLIQGQLQRPEISVVTGDEGRGDEGLLRLREHFLDRMAIDQAEETP